MATLDRNGDCPCGSGKKYKRCCGANVAISITSLLEREVEQLQAQIISHADYMYGEIMDMDFDERVAPSLIDDEREIEFFGFIHTIWYTLFQPLSSGQTILEEFITQQSKLITKPSLRQVLQSWTNPRPFVGSLLDNQSHRVVVRHILTDEVITVKVLTAVPAAENSIVFGFILPFREEFIFFPTFFDMEGEPDGKDEQFLKEEFARSSHDNADEFLKAEIIELVNEIQFLSVEVNTAHFEWPLPVHKKVADRVVEDLKLVQAPDELIGTALLLWNRYCKIKPKQIKTTSVYAAAMQYVAMSIHPLVLFSPEDFAAEAGINPTSMKRVVKELEATLESELEELRIAILEDLEELGDSEIESVKEDEWLR